MGIAFIISKWVRERKQLACRARAIPKSFYTMMRWEGRWYVSEANLAAEGCPEVCRE
jgi:hypothetical protein